MEIKTRNSRLQSIRRLLGYEGMLTVDPIGRSGGLAFMWLRNNEVEIISYSSRHISAKISLEGSGYWWEFTGFYGHPDRNLRAKSWQLLSHLSFDLPQDWLCAGDFNEIADWSEKVGGQLRSIQQMDLFRSTLVECNLGDLGFKGPKFTWNNQRPFAEFIK